MGGVVKTLQRSNSLSRSVFSAAGSLGFGDRSLFLFRSPFGNHFVTFFDVFLAAFCLSLLPPAGWSLQGGPGTEPESETGTVGTVFAGTERGTGTAGTVFRGTETGTGTVLSMKLYWNTQKTTSLEEPPEPKTGTARTVPSPNRNRTEPNRGHPVFANMQERPEIGTGKRGHYERGLFTGGISRISGISKFSREISTKWSHSSLFSRVWGFSGISKFSRISRKWSFLKDAFFKRPFSEPEERWSILHSAVFASGMTPALESYLEDQMTLDKQMSEVLRGSELAG